MTGRMAGYRPAARVAGIIAAVMIVSLSGAAAQGTSTAHSLRESRTSSHLAEEVSDVAPAEFSRLSAQEYQQPAVNGGDYRACVKDETTVPYEYLYGYLAGYSNAAKLDGSLPSGFPAAAVAKGLFSEGYGVAPNGDDLVCTIAQLQLDYNGLRELPPMRATFDAYGFMPVTATVTLEQATTAPIEVVIYGDEDAPPTAPVQNTTPKLTVVAVGQFDLQISDVDVNGVPLDVSASCRADGTVSTPGNPVGSGDLVLSGGDVPGEPVPWQGEIQQGGALAGLVSIPPLTGCATPTGENLDAVLSAAVSDSSDYVELVEGAPCTTIGLCVSENNGMPLASQPDYEVTNGGAYSATSSVKLGDENGLATPITCANSEISGSFPDMYGPLRGSFATMNWTFQDCTSDGGATSWTIQQTGDIQLASSYLCDTPTPVAPCTSNKILRGQMDNASFLITQTSGGSCHAYLSGYEVAVYTMTTAVLKFAAAGPQLYITGSTCGQALPDTDSESSYDTYALVGAYQMTPTDITVSPAN
jgi:hypothetical protein